MKIIIRILNTIGCTGFGVGIRIIINFHNIGSSFPGKVNIRIICHRIWSVAIIHFWYVLGLLSLQHAESSACLSFDFFESWAGLWCKGFEGFQACCWLGITSFFGGAWWTSSGFLQHVNSCMCLWYCTVYATWVASYLCGQVLLYLLSMDYNLVAWSAV